MCELAQFDASMTDALFEEVSTLIEKGRTIIVAQSNAAQIMTYWSIGRAIDADILKKERAPYGQQIMVTLADRLTVCYGRTYYHRNLRRMVQFSKLVPAKEIVSAPWTQLGWSHIRELLPLPSAQAREFYAHQAVECHLGVRELAGVIQRKAFERQEIADSRIEPGSAVPMDTFKDPYLLDFLGLQGAYQEADLEAAILRELEKFLLEFGKGFAFVARQKRMSLDSDDFYLDLLFFFSSTTSPGCSRVEAG